MKVVDYKDAHVFVLSHDECLELYDDLKRMVPKMSDINAATYDLLTRLVLRS